MSYSRRLNRVVMDGMRKANQLHKLEHPREHFIYTVLDTSQRMGDTSEQRDRRLASALKAFDDLRRNVA